MSDKNLELWNRHEKTDPQYVEKMKFGNKLSAIDAYYRIKLATEEFGPFGIGWGIGFQEWRYIGESVLDYHATLWYKLDNGEKGEFPIDSSIEWKTQSKDEFKKIIPGQWHIDDEATKKVKTDAITKGLSMLGFCADVFLGKFDDNKYASKMPENKERKDSVPQSNQTAMMSKPHYPTTKKENEPPKQTPTDNRHDLIQRLKDRIHEKISADPKVAIGALRKYSEWTDKDGKKHWAGDWESLSEKAAEITLLRFEKDMFERKMIEFVSNNPTGGENIEQEYKELLKNLTSSDKYPEGLSDVSKVSSLKWIYTLNGKLEDFIKSVSESSTKEEVDINEFSKFEEDYGKENMWTPDHEND